MCFKQKKMRMRQARAVALTQAQNGKKAEKNSVPAWSELLKMGTDEVRELAEKMGLTVTGNIMRDRSAIHRAR